MEAENDDSRKCLPSRWCILPRCEVPESSYYNDLEKNRKNIKNRAIRFLSLIKAQEKIKCSRVNFDKKFK